MYLRIFEETVQTTYVTMACCDVSPKLTWRDMQHIVMMSSRTEPLRDAYWIVNGVGRKGDFVCVITFVFF